MEKLHQSEIHPDSWPAAFIRNPADTEARLAAVAGDKYSYRELDDFTDLMGERCRARRKSPRLNARACCRSRFISITRNNVWPNTA